jgi:hypothetical protein
MGRVVEQIRVSAPAAVVFDVALSFEAMRTYERWNPAFRRGLTITATTGGAGTTFEFPLEAPGAVARAEILEYDPPSRIVACWHGGVFAEATTVITVDGHAGGGSVITHDCTYTVRSAAAALAIDRFLMRPRIIASARAQLEAMKERAEHALRAEAA